LTNILVDRSILELAMEALLLVKHGQWEEDTVAGRALIAGLRDSLTQKGEPVAHLPTGWRIQRNSDGSIGLFAPPPCEGESRRTSECFSPAIGNDVNEIVYKLLSHMLAQQPEPVGEVVCIDQGDDERGPEAIVALHNPVDLGTMLYAVSPSSTTVKE